MAFTFTREAAHKSDAFGASRVVIGVVTADAASGVIGTAAVGLKYIYGGSVCARSCGVGSVAFSVRFNATTAGASAPGVINFTSCTTGDDINVTLWGR